jgi:type IV pilus assembly protein PilB
MTADDLRSPPAPGATPRLTGSAFGLAQEDLDALTPDPQALALVSPDFAKAHRVFPVRRTSTSVVLAIADALDTEGLDRLTASVSLTVEAVLASPESIDAAIARHYPMSPSPTAPALPVVTVLSSGEAGEGLTDDPVVREVQAILDEAVRRRASDIHLEPMGRRFRIRYRVDGRLVEGPIAARGRQAGIISRLKIMANLSIAERRLPQDGRLRGLAGGRAMDVRVSSLPTVHGESLVLRLLDQSALRVDLSELGLGLDHREEMTRLLGLADGLVLVTGPTGSGKTTTLYSFLNYINGPGRKIITVEDPVEYQLLGINQVPVRPEIGMTFAAALRAMLRQAPNVIMVGEIRDRETAEIALQAALTGHLVFSTLHTNDASGAISRLLDLGARPYLVAGALRAAVAQRLVRQLCGECRQTRPRFASQTRPDDDGGEAGREVWARGGGCAACDGTGYRGRTGLFEVLPVTDETRQIICENAAPGRLRAHARSQGCRTLREDGIRKAAAGLTTLEEVMAATVDDAS